MSALSERGRIEWERCLKLGADKMPIASPRYAFTAIMIAGAPPDPGVYALWERDELIYYGRALGNDVTIQSRRKCRVRRCLLYTSPSPRDGLLSRMPSSA